MTRATATGIPVTAKDVPASHLPEGSPIMDALYAPLEAETPDVATWSRERLVASYLAFRALYAAEAMARRVAVAERLGLEAQLASCREQLADLTRLRDQEERDQRRTFVFLPNRDDAPIAAAHG